MYFASVKLEVPLTYSLVVYYLAIWSLRSTLGWCYVDRHYESGLGDEFWPGFCASYQMANTAEQLSWLHLLVQGWEVGVLKGWEMGEVRGNCKQNAGVGNVRYGRRTVWTPCLLPQNKLPLSAFHASCPLCLYPNIRSIQWCNLSETYWHSSASRFFLMKSPASTWNNSIINVWNYITEIPQ